MKFWIERELLRPQPKRSTARRVAVTAAWATVLLARPAVAQGDYYRIEPIGGANVVAVTNVNDSGVLAYTDKVGASVYQSYLVNTGAINGKQFTKSIGQGLLVKAINDHKWIAATRPSDSAPYLYVPTFLGPLAPGWNAIGRLSDGSSLGSYFGMGINNSGQVVWSGTNAYLWTPGGIGGIPGNLQIRQLGGPDSQANSINDAGVICGTAIKPNNGFWPCTFPQGSPISFLPLYDGFVFDRYSQGYALHVNKHGEIVGQLNANVLGSAWHAFVYLPAPAYGLPAGMHDLSLGAGLDINDYGHVIVSQGAGGGGFPGYLWVERQQYLPGALIAPASRNPLSLRSINNRGQIVAYQNDDATNRGYRLLTPKFRLASLTFAGQTAGVVRSGSTITGRVSLNMPAPFNIDVTLKNPAPMAVHAWNFGTFDPWDTPAPTTFHVTIPEGATSADFQLEGLPVTKSTPVTLDAEFYQTHVTGVLTVSPQALPAGTPGLRITGLDLTNFQSDGGVGTDDSGSPTPTLNVSGTLRWTTNLPTNSIVRYGPSTAYSHKHQRGEIAGDKSIDIADIDPAPGLYVWVTAIDVYGRTAHKTIRITLPAILEVVVNRTDIYFDPTKLRNTCHATVTFTNVGGMAATDVLLLNDQITNDVGKVDPNQLNLATLAAGASVTQTLMNRDDPTDPLDFDGPFNFNITDQTRYRIILQGSFSNGTWGGTVSFAVPKP